MDKDDLLNSGSIDPLEPEKDPARFFFEFSAALELLFMASQTEVLKDYTVVRNRLSHIMLW